MSGNRRGVWACVAMVIGATVNAKTLYLVGGHSDQSGEKHAVRIYKLQAGTKVEGRAVLGESQGSSRIHLNYAAKRLVVVPSSDAPSAESGKTRLIIVSFDKPDENQEVVLPDLNGSSVVDSGFVGISGGDYYYYVLRRSPEGKGPQALTVRMDYTHEIVSPSIISLRNRQSIGFSGFESEEFPLVYDSASGSIKLRSTTEGLVDLTPAIPAKLRPKGDWVRLGARNEVMTTLSIPSGGVMIFSEKTGWTKPEALQLTGPQRVFRNWLTARLAKPEARLPRKAAPGREIRLGPDVTHGRTGPNHRMSERLLSERFLNALIVYNVETKQYHRIETSDSNCEVLWIDQTAVYYRVNGAIYRRENMGRQLGEARVVAEGDEIWDVHWAFWN